MANTLYDEFVARWPGFKLDSSSGMFLLAVSGGVDSMVLGQLFKKANIPFAVAHCNFMLRGQEAKADQDLVVEWCRMNDIECYVKAFETKTIAEEWKKAIQETARILRYEWFRELKAQYSFVRIVTAHHANDNIETLLMKLCKGTGLAGLHGILPDSNDIFRPLLFATKDEIVEYAIVNKIAFREDASNSSEDYLRNAVRLRLMPVIRDLFPEADQNISRSIERFREAEVLYRKAIETEKKKLLEQRGNDYYIPILKLRKCEPLMTILYELLLPFGFHSAQLSQIRDLLDAETGHYFVSPTHRLIKNREFLIITNLPTRDADFIVVQEADNQTVEAGGYAFHFAERKVPLEIETEKNIAYLNLKEVKYPLILRRWKQGDYFYPFGMKLKKKKISKFFVDLKVPLHEKENIWVLESCKRICWVAGLRTDERFRIDDKTEKALVIKMQKL